MTERGGDLAMLGWSYLCLIRVRFSRGELIGAQDIVQKMEHITQATDMPPWITRLAAAWRARILLAQGQLQAATQWVAERGLDATIEHPTYLREREYILLARILIAQGRQGSANVLLQRLLKATEAGARSSRMIEILLLQALVARADGQTSKSMNTLEQALTLAEPGGFIQLFVDEGLPMAKLLSEAVALGNRSGGPSGSLRGSLLDYCARLLAAFEAQEQRGADRPFLPPAPPAQPLMDQLSRRELEVLQLIAQGLSNREIAQRLFLALNTVKGHNRNIFEKLQVHRRTEAVARARALGLL